MFSRDFIQGHGLDQIGLASYGKPKEDVEEFIESEFVNLYNPLLYVAFEQGKPVGYLAVERYIHQPNELPDCFWKPMLVAYPKLYELEQRYGQLQMCSISGIAVNPTAQGGGFGKQLMHTVLEDQIHTDIIAGICKNPVQAMSRLQSCGSHNFLSWLGTTYLDESLQYCPQFIRDIASAYINKEGATFIDEAQQIVKLPRKYLSRYTKAYVESLPATLQKLIDPVYALEAEYPKTSLALPLVSVHMRVQEIFK